MSKPNLIDGRRATYQCRACHTVVDGLGIVCIGCGTTLRIPIQFADGRKRYLPRGMTIDAFDEWIQQQTDAQGEVRRLKVAVAECQAQIAALRADGEELA